MKLNTKKFIFALSTDDRQIYGNHKGGHDRTIQQIFRIPDTASSGQRRAFQRVGEPTGCTQDGFRVLRPLSEKDRGMHHQLRKDEI